MNEFLAFDDADWELASAYLDNEVTSAERAHVEASPALIALVADLRSMQSSVAAQAPAGIDRDAIITVAIAGTVDYGVVGRVAGSGRLGDELEPPLATAPVTSISGRHTQRAAFWKAPMLLAAALLTVAGIGFGVRSGSRGDSQKTSGAAVSAPEAANVTQDQSTDFGAVPPVGAAAPATTAAPAALPARTAATTAAAAAAITAAPAATTPATATTAAAAATAAISSATTAGPAASNATSTSPPATGAPTTAADAPLPLLTLQELKDLVVASAANPSAQTTLVCPDPRGVPRLSVQILWNGQPAIVFIDQISQTLVVLAVNGCTPVANIPIKDLAQS